MPQAPPATAGARQARRGAGGRGRGGPAGTDMDLGGATSVPVASFARIPHDAIPAIRDAVREPMLSVPGRPVEVSALAARVADAWRVWHTSAEHRTDVGRILPRLVTDARVAARASTGDERRAANALLADVYALVQHETVWASEAELTWTVADRAMLAAQEADTPAALAEAAPRPLASRSQPRLRSSRGCDGGSPAGSLRRGLAGSPRTARIPSTPGMPSPPTRGRSRSCSSGSWRRRYRSDTLASRLACWRATSRNGASP